MYAEREWRKDSPTTTAVGEVGREAAARNGDVARLEDRTATGEAVVRDFATAVARATDADQIRGALAAAVAWSGDGSARLALGDEPARGRPGAPGIPIRAAGGRTWGRIDLNGSGGAAPAVRRLEAVAAIAALALDRLDRAARAHSPAADATPPHDAALLGAVLPFAIGQARRHGEPLSILLMTIDQLRGVRKLLGREEADRLVSRVGARLAGLLRASDLVGRLDGERLLAILPRAELHAAGQVGRKLARAVAADASLSGLPLGLTISVGVAELPRSAETLGGLLDAADASLAEARRRLDAAAI